MHHASLNSLFRVALHLLFLAHIIPGRRLPLSSEHGTNETIKTRLWPGLEPFSNFITIQVVPFLLASGTYAFLVRPCACPRPPILCRGLISVWKVCLPSMTQSLIQCRGCRVLCSQETAPVPSNTVGLQVHAYGRVLWGGSFY